MSEKDFRESNFPTDGHPETCQISIPNGIFAPPPIAFGSGQRLLLFVLTPHDTSHISSLGRRDFGKVLNFFWVFERVNSTYFLYLNVAGVRYAGRPFLLPIFA